MMELQDHGFSAVLLLPRGEDDYDTSSASMRQGSHMPERCIDSYLQVRVLPCWAGEFCATLGGVGKPPPHL